MRTGEVLGQDLCSFISYGVGVQYERLQGLILLEGLHQRSSAFHANAILAQVCCLTPAEDTQASRIVRARKDLALLKLFPPLRIDGPTLSSISA